MNEAWPAIVGTFEACGIGHGSGELERAVGGIQALATSIAEGPLASILFGWTSMFDLCIQQTDAEPYSAPYLRVSPSPSGMVEFRYIDTSIAERQWHRTVPLEAVVARLDEFLRQLRWVDVAQDGPSS